LAEYRDSFDDFRGLGIHIAALAVDSPEQSDRVRRQYELPFPILCDTQREVVRAWGVYNAEEKGGIAVPAVLLLGRDRRIRWIMIESVSSRVRPGDLLEFFRAHPVSSNAAEDTLSGPQRRAIFPSLVDIGRAIRNSLSKL
jgi:peroxiredoxin